MIMPLGYISYIPICNYVHWSMQDEMTTILLSSSVKEKEGGVKKERKGRRKNMIRFQVFVIV